MPTLPELSHGGGEIGVVKVFVKPEAQNPPQADGHVGVAGKVKVNLKAEGKKPCPAPRNRQRPGVLRGLAALPQGPGGVGQQHLLGKARGKAAGSFGEVPGRDGPVNQLRRHGLVLHDGPGDELGEQRHVGPEADDVPLDRRVPAVDIDGVAHGLEGEEGNAQGQGQSQLGNGHPGKQGQIRRQEVPVLEKAQEQKVEHHRLPHEPTGQPVLLPEPLHQEAVGVVDEDGEEHNPHVHRLSPAVEKKAGQKQHKITPPKRRKKVQRQRQRQISEQKRQAAENHGLLLGLELEAELLL